MMIVDDSSLIVYYQLPVYRRMYDDMITDGLQNWKTILLELGSQN